MTRLWRPADRPTLYFIGVSTAQSSIMRIFPRWAQALQLGDCALVGLDFAIGARPESYRQAVDFIKRDELSRGALVTTHKIDLLAASADLFDELDAFASSQREVSCLSKRGGRLVGHAKDPISARLALEAIVPQGHFASNGAAVFVIGAGGATTAITWSLMQPENRAGLPLRIVVSDVRQERLDALRRFHAGLEAPVTVDYVHATEPAENDRRLAGLPAGSLVINATGMGKDRPGSPLADPRFPRHALVWELNYRGDLVFLQQARAQAQAGSLTLADGWNYFLHGWTQVIAEVFAIDIPPSGPRFELLSELAG